MIMRSRRWHTAYNYCTVASCWSFGGFVFLETFAWLLFRQPEFIPDVNTHAKAGKHCAFAGLVYLVAFCVSIVYTHFQIAKSKRKETKRAQSMPFSINSRCVETKYIHLHQHNFLFFHKLMCIAAMQSFTRKPGSRRAADIWE